MIGVLRSATNTRTIDDVASFPNPFQGVNTQTSYIHDETTLTLVDGGEDLQNLPLHPLTQPQRNVDVIFAVDSSADTLEENGALNWPNGTALVATYERSLLPIANETSFPAIPDVNTFVNLGLNNRPVFFGCDVKNTTAPTPLVVYIPNTPYSYLSNVSTFQLDYTHQERGDIIQNGFNVGKQPTFLFSSFKLSSVCTITDARIFDSYNGQRHNQQTMANLRRLRHPASKLRQDRHYSSRSLQHLL